MSKQLPLDLRPKPALDRVSFMVTDCNAEAVRTVEDLTLWPGRKLALVGPMGAGKTHLAMVWAAQVGASVTSAKLIDPAAPTPEFQVIEDVDRIAGDPLAEEAVFHLHNAVLNQGGALLFTGRTPPQRWPIALPDLASRLRAAGVARLDSPDEALLTAVMVKLFADRGVKASPTLVHYVLVRIERTMASVEQTVARLCEAGFASGRKIGRKLAAEVLDGG
ncbi:MAG: DnaA/Hda family protein [Pseudomonadota bacterium]